MEKKPRMKKEKQVTKRELADVNLMLDNLESNTFISKRKPGKPLTVEQKKHNYIALGTILSEYLDSYIIMGYDLSEEPFVAMRSVTSMQNKAVMGLLSDVADKLLMPTR